SGAVHHALRGSVASLRSLSLPVVPNSASSRLLPFRFEIQCSAVTALGKIEPLPVTPASGRRSACPLPRESSLSCSPPSSSTSEAPRPRSPGYLRSCRSLGRRTTGGELSSSGRLPASPRRIPEFGTRLASSGNALDILFGARAERIPAGSRFQQSFAAGALASLSRS